jgi:RNA polymerase sigma-70 factor (ECF subfamily)
MQFASCRSGVSERSFPVGTGGFEIVYREHRETIRRFLIRKLADPDTAEDLTQEVFLRAHQGWGGKRSGVMLGWLHRIALNVYIDHRRRLERRPAEIPWGEGEEGAPAERVAAAQELEPQAILLLEERRAAIRRAVAGLAPGYADVLGLRYNEDLPLAEIAARLHVPVSTVKARLHRGLRQLKSVLEDAPRV